MNTLGPIVGLQLQSRPQSLTIVRGMLSGVAELLEMDPELLDDLKTAVSEACNNVVLHAYDESPGPMVIRLYATAEELTVVVCDEGTGLSKAGAGAGADPSQGIGVSVIRALTSAAEFATRDAGGTAVTMRFPARRDGHSLYAAPEAAEGDLTLSPAHDGEIALTLSPVSLLTGVLGRLARTLAATAHFSLDRFSDVYLVTDTLAAHAARAAVGGRIAARLTAGDRRLELEVGPFRRGSGDVLVDSTDPVASPLPRLADELAVAAWGEDEAIGVVVVDHRR